MELISGVTPDVILMPGFSLWFPDTADSSGNDFAHAPLPREHFILVSEVKHLLLCALDFYNLRTLRRVWVTYSISFLRLNGSLLSSTQSTID